MAENQLQRTLNQPPPPPPPKILRHVTARTWAVTRLRRGHREPWLKPHHVQLRQPSAGELARPRLCEGRRSLQPDSREQGGPAISVHTARPRHRLQVTPDHRRSLSDVHEKIRGPPSRPRNTVLACAGKTSNLVAFQAWVRKERAYRITTQ